jgi:hypothetical protein
MIIRTIGIDLGKSTARYVRCGGGWSRIYGWDIKALHKILARGCAECPPNRTLFSEAHHGNSCWPRNIGRTLNGQADSAVMAYGPVRTPSNAAGAGKFLGRFVEFRSGRSPNK